MRKVLLVTGGTGFVGRHFMDCLSNDDFDEVHVLVRREPPSFLRNVESHVCDLDDSSKVAEIMAEIRPTHLAHFSWYAVPGKFWNDESENKKSLKYSINLLDSFVRNGGERVLAIGTCAEYDWANSVDLAETSNLRPDTIYGRYKKEFLEYLEDFCRKNSVSYVWGRLFHLFGPHEKTGRLVSDAIVALLRGETFSCSDGKQLIDISYVFDVAMGLKFLLCSDCCGVFNVSSGIEVSVADIIGLIAKKTGAEGFVKLGVLPRGNVPARLVSDNRKIRKMTNWVSEYSLERGLDETILWWREVASIKFS